MLYLQLKRIMLYRLAFTQYCIWVFKVFWLRTALPVVIKTLITFSFDRLCTLPLGLLLLVSCISPSLRSILQSTCYRPARQRSGSEATLAPFPAPANCQGWRAETGPGGEHVTRMIRTFRRRTRSCGFHATCRHKDSNKMKKLLKY